MSGPQSFFFCLERFAKLYLGRSLRTISRPSSACAVNRLSWRVVLGSRSVRTSPLRPTRVLSKLDLSTFERPANATSASAGGGSWSGEVTLHTKLASTIAHAGFGAARVIGTSVE